MASWGDLNARLNGLVRAGVISGFRTNLASRPDLGSLEIVVLRPAGHDDGRVPPEDLSGRVRAALSAIAPQAKIRVEDTAL